MQKLRRVDHPHDKPGRPADWKDEIKTDLDAQLANGATLYGIRSDGAYIAKTKNGERVISRPPRQTDSPRLI